MNNETTAAEMAKSLGIAKDFAQVLLKLGSQLPPECHACGGETQQLYIMRPADYDRSFGKPEEGNCRCPVLRLCLGCQADMGPDGIKDYVLSLAQGG